MNKYIAILLVFMYLASVKMEQEGCKLDVYKGIPRVICEE